VETSWWRLSHGEGQWTKGQSRRSWTASPLPASVTNPKGGHVQRVDCPVGIVVFLQNHPCVCLPTGLASPGEATPPSRCPRTSRRTPLHCMPRLHEATKRWDPARGVFRAKSRRQPGRGGTKREGPRTVAQRHCWQPVGRRRQVRNCHIRLGEEEIRPQQPRRRTPLHEKMRHELALPPPSWGAGEEGLRDPADGGACGRIRTAVMRDAHALRAGGCGMTALRTGGRHAAVCRVRGLESMVA
jgi:hypothetical protein